MDPSTLDHSQLLEESHTLGIGGEGEPIEPEVVPLEGFHPIRLMGGEVLWEDVSTQGPEEGGQGLGCLPLVEASATLPSHCFQGVR